MKTRARDEWANFLTECHECGDDLTITNGKPARHECWDEPES